MIVRYVNVHLLLLLLTGQYISKLAMTSVIIDYTFKMCF